MQLSPLVTKIYLGTQMWAHANSYEAVFLNLISVVITLAADEPYDYHMVTTFHSVLTYRSIDM